MTTLERANLLVHELRSGMEYSGTSPAHIIAILHDLIQDHADACNTILLQAARLRALESELTTLQASVVDALSSAGPEVGEDERAS